jgi:hypothetical protein
MIQHANCMAVMKWTDKSDVLFISTESEDVTVDTTNKRSQTGKKPK